MNGLSYFHFPKVHVISWDSVKCKPIESSAQELVVLVYVEDRLPLHIKTNAIAIKIAPEHI